jgi:hypothetical protein
MELRENKGERPRHVIEKIRRISLSVDRGEFWTLIGLAILFSVLVGGLVYYFFL